VKRSSALVLGSPVTCEDGTGGELSSLVIDSTTLRLTTIVVGGAVEPARLVPFELISGLHGDRTEVSCTSASIEGFEPAKAARVLDVCDHTGGWGLVSLIYACDSSPEAVLRSRERVMACDGAVGRVHGCRIDSGRFPGQLAAMLVNVGHAGEEHIIDVPTRAITSMKGLVVLDMTRETARDLPRIEL
jgi:hypothetical protein